MSQTFEPADGVNAELVHMTRRLSSSPAVGAAGAGGDVPKHDFALLHSWHAVDGGGAVHAWRSAMHPLVSCAGSGRRALTRAWQPRRLFLGPAGSEQGPLRDLLPPAC